MYYRLLFIAKRSRMNVFKGYDSNFEVNMYAKSCYK